MSNRPNAARASYSASEAVAALVRLGYTAKDAAAALSRAARFLRGEVCALGTVTAEHLRAAEAQCSLWAE